MDELTFAPDECATKLKALADSTRLAIFESLMSGPMHVNTLMKLHGVEQSLLSHHLRVLRDAGLVVAQRDGKAVLYQVASPIPSTSSGKVIDLGCCQLTF